MARKTGRVAVLEIQTDGAAGSAGWNDVATKRDLTFSHSTEEVDLSASELYDSFGAGPQQFAIEGEIVKDLSDTEYNALRSAKAAGTSIGFWALDAADGAGMQFDGIVTRFDDAASRRDGQMTSIRIVVAAGGQQPAWTAKP